jgi:lysophospholipase L1-like esterase
VEVWAPHETGAIVAFGDSITDGVGTKQGEYNDWPDVLAARLKQRSADLSVINAGIAGNRILHDGAGISALARLDRDVLAHPGVTHLIILEGTNDMGWPYLNPRARPGSTAPATSPYADEMVSAQDIIAGYQQIIDRAHEHGIKVFGATITPYEGANDYSPEGEAIRQKVNQWIRTSHAFDGVFDFDAAVRDPKHPSQLRDDYQSGDHIHPSAAGYKVMVDAIDLSVLTGVKGAATGGR